MTADDIVRAFDPARLKKPPPAERIRAIAEHLAAHREIGTSMAAALGGVDHATAIAVMDILANKRDGIGRLVLDVYHCHKRIERREWAEGFPYVLRCPHCGSTDVNTLKFDVVFCLPTLVQQAVQAQVDAMDTHEAIEEGRNGEWDESEDVMTEPKTTVNVTGCEDCPFFVDPGEYPSYCGHPLSSDKPFVIVVGPETRIHGDCPIDGGSLVQLVRKSRET